MDKPHHKDKGYQVWLRADKKRREQEEKENIEARKEFYDEKGYWFARDPNWMENARKKIEEQGFDKDTLYGRNEDGSMSAHIIKKRFDTKGKYKKTYYKGDMNELWGNIDRMSADEISEL